MPYDPRQPHENRYVQNAPPTDPALGGRVVSDCLTLCRALGYDINTVEFAVRNGIPYAIDFLNPAPDAEYHSVGRDNFDWVVDAVAELAVQRALSQERTPVEYRWSSFLKGKHGGNNAKPADDPAATKKGVRTTRK